MVPEYRKLMVQRGFPRERERVCSCVSICWLCHGGIAAGFMAPPEYHIALPHRPHRGHSQSYSCSAHETGMKTRHSFLVVLVVASWIGQVQSWGGGVSSALVAVVQLLSTFKPAIPPHFPLPRAVPTASLLSCCCWGVHCYHGRQC